MPIYTFSHCLICYQKDASGTIKPPPTPDKDSGRGSNSNSSNDDNGNGKTKVPAMIKAFREVNKRREVCRRFCTLSSRYVNLDPYYYQPDRTLCSKHIVNTDYVCDDCYPMIKSFCEIYDLWTSYQLQLDCRLKEIADVMMAAEVTHAQHREALVKHFKNMGDGPEELDDFRKDFRACVEKKRNEAFPRVKLSFKNMPEDPDFVPLKTEPGKKKSPKSKPKGSSSPRKKVKQEVSPPRVKKAPTSKKLETPTRKRRRSQSPPPSPAKSSPGRDGSTNGDSDSDSSSSSSSIFSPVRVSKDGQQVKKVAAAPSTTGPSSTSTPIKKSKTKTRRSSPSPISTSSSVKLKKKKKGLPRLGQTIIGRHRTITRSSKSK